MIFGVIDFLEYCCMDIEGQPDIGKLINVPLNLFPKPNHDTVVLI